MEDGSYDWCNATTTAATCVAKGLGGVGGMGMAPCRFSPSFPICNLCTPESPGYGIDPTGLELLFVQIAHFLPFATTVLVTACFFYNLDAIKSRIGNVGCGMFNLGNCFLALGSLCEFANHALIMNWNMCYDTSDNVLYLMFYVFLSAGNTLLALGLLKEGTSLLPKKFSLWKLLILRKFTFTLDGLSMIVDWTLIFLNFLIIPTWFKRGRVACFYLFIPTQSLAGVVEFVRMWKNLGPENAMFSYPEGVRFGTGAFVMEFVSVFLSIKVNNRMYLSGKQWQHGALAICFGLNEFLLCWCLLNAYPSAYQKKSTTVVKNGGETQSLL